MCICNEFLEPPKPPLVALPVLLPFSNRVGGMMPELLCYAMAILLPPCDEAALIPIADPVLL